MTRAMKPKELAEIKVTGVVVRIGDNLTVKHYGKILRVQPKQFFFYGTTWIIYEQEGKTFSVPRSMCQLPDKDVPLTHHD